MRAVFKQDRVHMFTMNKILNENLYPRDEEWRYSFLFNSLFIPLLSFFFYHYYRFFFKEYFFSKFCFFLGLPACSILISRTRKKSLKLHRFSEQYSFFLEKGKASKGQASHLAGVLISVLSWFIQVHIGHVSIHFILFYFPVFFHIHSSNSVKAGVFYFYFYFFFLYSYVVRDTLSLIVTVNALIFSQSIDETNLYSKHIPTYFLGGQQCGFYVYTSIHPIVVYTLAVNLV